jgi:hypothetical protein
VSLLLSKANEAEIIDLFTAMFWRKSEKEHEHLLVVKTVLFDEKEECGKLTMERMDDTCMQRVDRRARPTHSSAFTLFRLREKFELVDTRSSPV